MGMSKSNLFGKKEIIIKKLIDVDPELPRRLLIDKGKYYVEVFENHGYAVHDISDEPLISFIVNIKDYANSRFFLTYGFCSEESMSFL